MENWSREGFEVSDFSDTSDYSDTMTICNLLTQFNQQMRGIVSILSNFVKIHLPVLALF